MKEGKHKKESVFELNGGMPPLGQALPLAFQHIVAMIVGCVTPAIIIAGVAGLSGEDKVIIVPVSYTHLRTSMECARWWALWGRI